ncbi:MAG: TM1266 family iron-only hydrogenase system putative regulator [Eubacteriales bacterium]|jgi:putative iron-only hydrogenase system regulator
MEEKIGVVAVVVEDFDKTDRVNELLHEYREYIVGRLGIPFKDRGTAVISVVMSAAAEKINALSGKLGMIEGVRSKVLFR